MQHSTCMRTDTIKQKLCQPRPSILICSLRNVGQSVSVVVNEPCTGSMNKPLSCRAIKSQLLRGDVKVHRERRNLLLLPSSCPRILFLSHLPLIKFSGNLQWPQWMTTKEGNSILWDDIFTVWIADGPLPDRLCPKREEAEDGEK